MLGTDIGDVFATADVDTLKTLQGNSETGAICRLTKCSNSKPSLLELLREE